MKDSISDVTRLLRLRGGEKAALDSCCPPCTFLLAPVSAPACDAPGAPQEAGDREPVEVIPDRDRIRWVRHVAATRRGLPPGRRRRRSVLWRRGLPVVPPVPLVHLPERPAEGAGPSPEMSRLGPPTGRPVGRFVRRFACSGRSARPGRRNRGAVRLRGPAEGRAPAARRGGRARQIGRGSAAPRLRKGHRRVPVALRAITQPGATPQQGTCAAPTRRASSGPAKQTGRSRCRRGGPRRRGPYVSSRPLSETGRRVPGVMEQVPGAPEEDGADEYNSEHVDPDRVAIDAIAHGKSEPLGERKWTRTGIEERCGGAGPHGLAQRTTVSFCVRVSPFARSRTKYTPGAREAVESDVSWRPASRRSRRGVATRRPNRS